MVYKAIQNKKYSKMRFFVFGPDFTTNLINVCSVFKYNDFKFPETENFENIDEFIDEIEIKKLKRKSPS